MASYDTEVRFIGRWLRSAELRDPIAWRVLEILRPGMIEDPVLDARFGLLSGRLAAGEALEDPDDEPDELWRRIADEGFTASEALPLAVRIRTNWAARRQLEILRLGVLEADKAIASTNGKAKHVAERLSMALLDLFAAGGDDARARTFREIVDQQLAGMTAEEEAGVPVPWSRLERECGPWVPGDVVGISAYSNAGKSTFAANLTLNWARRGFPVLAFPTEMREQWVARMLAADSGTRQWVAEKRRWKHSTDEEFRDFQGAGERALEWPIEVVNRASISPAEIIAATRVIRRRWKGRTVVVVVDHMHRLDYGNEDPNDAVGSATRLLKNFAGSDNEGGLVMLLLYQPRKPHGDVYGPIAGHQIRGDSTVWNELDVHLSPFRAWVKTDSLRVTSWGTIGTACDSTGRPRSAKAESDGAKLADEHVLVKIDKRRVGGEGPTVWLDFEQPCGRIFELEPDR